MQTFNLETYVPYQLSVLTRRLSRVFAAQCINKFDITIPEWRILAHLSYAGPCSVRDIHRDADLEKSRVSRAVPRLEKRGLIIRDLVSQDRRLINLALSPAGHRLVAEIAPLADSHQRELLRTISDAGCFTAGVSEAYTATKTC